MQTNPAASAILAAPGTRPRIPARLPTSPLDSLIASVATGDRVAFKALYEATAPKLFAVISRILSSRAQAEEVLQDVFLRVWRNAGSFSADAGAPMGWLVSIARNRAIDVIRQKTPITFGRDTTGDEGDDWFERIAEDRDRETEMVDLDALRKCLGEIEAEHRDCILLAYYEGWSREELAQKFDRPVNTIKTWLHRGLGSLKSCLESGS